MKVGFPIYNINEGKGRVVILRDVDVKPVSKEDLFYMLCDINYSPFPRVIEKIINWYKLFLKFNNDLDERIKPNDQGVHFKVTLSTRCKIDFVGDSHTLGMIFFAICKTLEYFKINGDVYQRIILTGQYPSDQFSWKKLAPIDDPIEKYYVLEKAIKEGTKKKTLYVYVPPTDDLFIKDLEGKNKKIKEGNEKKKIVVKEISENDLEKGLEIILKKVYGEDILSRIEKIFTRNDNFSDNSIKEKIRFEQKGNSIYISVNDYHRDLNLEKAKKYSIAKKVKDKWEIVYGALDEQTKRIEIEKGLLCIAVFSKTDSSFKEPIKQFCKEGKKWNYI